MGIPPVLAGGRGGGGGSGSISSRSSRIAIGLSKKNSSMHMQIKAGRGGDISNTRTMHCAEEEGQYAKDVEEDTSTSIVPKHNAPV